MAKKSRRGLSKKGLTGLKRITNKAGNRVFVFQKEEFKTLRDVRLKYPMR